MWTDNNLWKCSWADAVISVKGSHLFLMNCSPRAQRSPTSNSYFKPPAFNTDISLDSFSYVTITQVLKDTIMVVIFIAVTTNITVSFWTSQNPSSVQAAGVHLRSRHVCHRISRGIFTCRRDAPLLDLWMKPADTPSAQTWQMAGGSTLATPPSGRLNSQWESGKCYQCCIIWLKCFTFERSGALCERMELRDRQRRWRKLKSRDQCQRC